MRKTTALRKLLKKKEIVYCRSRTTRSAAGSSRASATTAIYTGGFVTGGSRCTSEPMSRWTSRRAWPATWRTRWRFRWSPTAAPASASRCTPSAPWEFIRAGIAGAHIEDQLYPKRAHNHKYVAHAIPRKAFVDKIRFACRQREQSDPDFVLIARTDTCRSEGLKEAVWRVNAAADAGADMGLIFPRNDEEMKKAPRQTKIPLVYAISRGNRDGRPLPTGPQLADMGYKAAIDALTYLLVSFHFAKLAHAEIKRTGGYSGLTQQQCVEARHEIETLVGLDEFYEIEEKTVEKESRRR